jgi:hypothetical protein
MVTGPDGDGTMVTGPDGDGLVELELLWHDTKLRSSAAAGTNAR